MAKRFEKVVWHWLAFGIYYRFYFGDTTRNWFFASFQCRENCARIIQTHKQQQLEHVLQTIMEWQLWNDNGYIIAYTLLITITFAYHILSMDSNLIYFRTINISLTHQLPFLFLFSFLKKFLIFIPFNTRRLHMMEREMYI